MKKKKMPVPLRFVGMVINPIVNNAPAKKAKNKDMIWSVLFNLSPNDSN